MSRARATPNAPQRTRSTVVPSSTTAHPEFIQKPSQTRFAAASRLPIGLSTTATPPVTSTTSSVGQAAAKEGPYILMIHGLAKLPASTIGAATAAFKATA